MKSDLLELGRSFQPPPAVHSQPVYNPFFIMEILLSTPGVQMSYQDDTIPAHFYPPSQRCLSCDGPLTSVMHCPSDHQSSLTYRREINASRVTDAKQLLSNYDGMIFKVPSSEIWSDINQSEQHYGSRRRFLENCKMINLLNGAQWQGYVRTEDVVHIVIIVSNCIISDNCTAL